MLKILQQKNYSTDNNNKNNVSPVLIYNDIENNKKDIIKENRKKSGIYRWINNKNKKSYIGSGLDLSRRIGSYYRLNELTRSIRPINAALLKYGLKNFTLEILEYCTEENLLNREQYYINLLEPEYNILKIAGSLLGFKHSKETLEKLKNRVITDAYKEILYSVHKDKNVTEETRQKLSKAITAYKSNNPLSIEVLEKLRAKTIEREGVTVIIKNTETNEEIIFSNQTEAGVYLGVSRQAIYNAIKRNSLLKGIYKITK